MLCIIIRVRWWILMYIAVHCGYACADEEPKSIPPIVKNTEGSKVESFRQPRRNFQDPDIDIDYDYFLYGIQKASSESADLSDNARPSTSNPTISDNNVNLLHGGSSSLSEEASDYYYYNYEADDLGSYHEIHGGDYYDIPDQEGYGNTNKDNKHVDHGPSSHNHDPFSVFYDSLFPVMDEEEFDEKEVNSPIKVDPQPSSSKQMPISSTAYPPLSYRSPTVAIDLPVPVPVERPTQKIQIPSLHQPQYVPRRNQSTDQKNTQQESNRKPNSSESVHATKEKGASVSKPMDLTHLKVLMPKILDKFGLPKSFGDNLFKDEAALQETLLEIMKDKTFRNALSMIPKFDLLNTDMTSVLGTLSNIDPSVVMNVLKNADMSRIMSLMSKLGIDLSYLSGVFNRGGAAADYLPKDGGEDDSKLIYIPILDAGSINNVQVLGFIVIMFFLLTTAYAYMEYGVFTTARKDGPPDPPSVTNEQLLGWGESDLWIPAVEATEDVQHRPWSNPHPPIHVINSGPAVNQRPSYQEVRRPTQKPTVIKLPAHRPSPVKRPLQRPTLAPAPAVRPGPYRPLRRRFRPKYNRRYQQNNGRPLMLTRQELLRLTRPRPNYRPARPVNRMDQMDPDFYDDYYSDYYEDYYYYGDLDDYYYYDPTESQQNPDDTDTSSREGVIRYSFRTGTESPQERPYTYYSFPGPRATAGTNAPTSADISSSSITTTTAPPTRPTSRYADTVRSRQSTLSASTDENIK